MSNDNRWQQAAGSNDCQALRRLHAEQVEGINAVGPDGRTALCTAAYFGQAEAVTLLLELGADPALGRPIHFAGQRQHHAIVRQLMGAGALDDELGDMPATARRVFEAVYAADPAALERALAADPQAVHTENDDEGRPLHVAAIQGDLACLRVLLAHGAEIDAEDDADRTAIAEAAGHQHNDAAQLLREAGAKVEIFAACEMNAVELVSMLLREEPNLARSTRNGISLLETVCEAGLVRVGRELLPHVAPDICSLATLGQTEAIRPLLQQNPELVRVRRRLFAYQPLHAAAECGQTDTVKLLLEHGADVNAGNEWNMRPLMFAIIAARNQPPTWQHHACCRSLIEAGADLHLSDDHHETALSLAEGTVQYGRKHGYDPEPIEANLRLIREALG